MTGKRYYIAALGAWQRHAARFATSHFVVLDAPGAEDEAEQGIATGDSGDCRPAPALDENTRILVLVEADEGAHLAHEDESSCEALPHPLTQQAISGAAQSALSACGVAPGATTFDAAEAAARIHPLLRHRVF